MPKRKLVNKGIFSPLTSCNFTMPKRKHLHAFRVMWALVTLQLYHAKAETHLSCLRFLRCCRVATLPCQSGNSPGAGNHNTSTGLQLYHAKAETRANLQLYQASATILSIPHFFLFCKLNSTYRDTIQFLSYHRCMSAASR